MPDSLSAASPNFAAVLLAGGRSRRMGFDKATLVINGQPLWQHQLATLRALRPRELFISGRRDGPYADAGVEIVEDDVPARGPLAGIASVLRRTRSDFLLVLAIDLPAMTSHFLASLLKEARGIIPKSAEGFEPLAAVYPRSALPIAAEILRSEDTSMQRFARQLIDAGLANDRTITAEEGPLFRNVNRPADLAVTSNAKTQITRRGAKS